MSFEIFFNFFLVISSMFLGICSFITGRKERDRDKAYAGAILCLVGAILIRILFV